MKKRIIMLVLLSFLGGVIVTSCKKYEEGPVFSLKTKKARLTGNWQIESATENGVDETELMQAFFGPIFLAIEKDDTYEIGGLSDEKGVWAFSADKESITLTPEDPSYNIKTYKILRLKDKELWLRMDDDGDVIIFKLKQ